MKIVFFGNSYVSAAILEYLISLKQSACEYRDFEVSSVVTSPPKPAGRGLELKENPVKIIASREGIPAIFETENLSSDKTLLSGLSDISPDIGVVVSYGKIIPRKIFSIPGSGSINLHFSLLPHLRGAAPIQWALMRGERKTGVSVFFINEKLDDGDVLVQKEVMIEDEDDFFTLREKLIETGKSALVESLSMFDKGIAFSSARPQDTLPVFSVDGSIAYASALKKSDGKIDWSRPASDIRNLIRGLMEWPVAHTFLPDGKMIKIFKAEVQKTCPGADGVCPSCRRVSEVTGIARGEGFLVCCGRDFLKITEVQPANSRRMSAWAFVVGGGVKVGDRFSH